VLLAEILERNNCGKDRVLIDGDDLFRLRRLAGFAELGTCRSVTVETRDAGGKASDRRFLKMTR
jgi:hypothetical protein